MGFDPQTDSVRPCCLFSKSSVAVPDSVAGLSRTDSSFASLLWPVVGHIRSERTAGSSVADQRCNGAASPSGPQEALIINISFYVISYQNRQLNHQSIVKVGCDGRHAKRAFFQINPM